MNRLPIKDPEESVVIEFDFSAEAASVSSPLVVASIEYSGPDDADPAPMAVLSGVPQVLGASVLQRVQGGIAGTDYGLRCLAITEAGDALVASAVLPVREKP
ncbi:MAG: hypothetical protein FWD62_05280 [Betaproteobacteria bacterium]|nr:hypothetical protein [Betaproteobacteria bacterium]